MTPVPAPVKMKDAEALENGDDEADEEEDEADGEVYVVEKILHHHDNFEDGAMRYEVKWKGYEKKADRTWETEENLEPIPGVSKTKKRSRQSTGSAAAEPIKKRKGRKSAAAAESSDATAEPPVGFTDVDLDIWKPPAPNKDAWEEKVQAVDTIEQDINGELWVYLVWNQKNEDGRCNRSKARLTTCKKACPQKMLLFYEKHV
ncbi:MAG: hypothetical protein Q9190_007124 [Brigantiaea leucoxantha]